MLQHSAALTLVQEVFAAFGRGDVPAILERLTDDVVWDVTGPPRTSYAGLRRGRDAALDFFRVLGQTVDVQRFEPREFIVQGDTVVVLGQETLRVKSTGAIAENRWVMVFTCRDGHIAQFREFDDTAAVAAAFAPLPSPD